MSSDSSDEEVSVEEDDTSNNEDEIEYQYFIKKHSILRQKLDLIQQEISLIKNSTHKEFASRSKELESIFDDKVEELTQWKDYQTQIIGNAFLNEKRQIEEDFAVEKQAMKEKMIQITNDRLKKANSSTTEKSYKELQKEINLDKTTRTSRRVRGENPEDFKDTYVNPSASYAKRRYVPPPVPFKLRDSEIIDDVKFLKNLPASTKQQKSKKT